MIFQVEERIAAPPEVVWRHLSDPALMAAWMPGIEDMRSRDGGPLRTGSALTFRARGAERSSSVAAFEPERLIALQSTQGAFTATYRYGLRAEGGATIVSLRAECSASGWMRLLAPLIRTLIRQSDRGQLALLRTCIEERPTAGSKHTC